MRATVSLVRGPSRNLIYIKITEGGSLRTGKPADLEDVVRSRAGRCLPWAGQPSAGQPASREGIVVVTPRQRLPTTARRGAPAAATRLGRAALLPAAFGA